MRILGIALAVLLVLAALVMILVYSGTYDVAADQPSGAVESWLLGSAQKRSVARAAAGIAVPNLTDPSRIREGAEHYAQMCQGCHGAPGRERSEIGMGLNPIPPDLAVAADEWQPSELFWMVKHGIKMTGMPAFGGTHGDDQVWSLVAFVSQLPKMSSAEYVVRTTAAETSGGAAPAEGEEPGEGSKTGHSHDEQGHGAPHKSAADAPASGS